MRCAVCRTQYNTQVHNNLVVLDLTEKKDDLLATLQPIAPQLGVRVHEELIQSLTAMDRSDPRMRVYLLMWEGGGVAGIEFDGFLIHGAQSQELVVTRNGTPLLCCSYERIVRAGGPRGLEQKMLVYILDMDRSALLF
jgi:hypothetical protein